MHNGWVRVVQEQRVISQVPPRIARIGNDIRRRSCASLISKFGDVVDDLVLSWVPRDDWVQFLGRLVCANGVELLRVCQRQRRARESLVIEDCDCLGALSDTATACG